jgi:hypothetical protein
MNVYYQRLADGHRPEGGWCPRLPGMTGSATARRAILCVTDNEAHPGRNLVNSWHD